ncbi:MAG TPA: pseudaminic acid cytidylyltransferase [Bacteroidales bacterium]|nr:pseudaminic acid cytidylyltransferase [Bacteroidales bacterium]HQL69800.1 pseudaminic acid cytidylyltransferase [Bacteroidales bacterium]
MKINKFINTTNLCIIPARGGSKRIPRKNIKEFLGKPIISYSIEAAIQSNLFEEIMVSTDDAEIAEIAKHYGATVPFMRSAQSSTDYAPLAAVVDEAVIWLDQTKNTCTQLCLILPTAPFILQRNIADAYNLMIEKNFDSVRPVVQFSYPIQRAFRLRGQAVEMMMPEHLKTRTQDLEPAYHDAGQFYWMTREKTLHGTNRGALIINDILAQDIDSENDWLIAEMKYRFLLEKGIITQKT